MPFDYPARRLRKCCPWPGAAIALCAVLAGHAAAATPVDEQAEIAKLMQSGQLAEAMRRVEGALMLNPSNARMRFSKGIILAQQGKSPEAITVLLKLTEDYPDLPEPYNNLAVLYAANGQYESARMALDKAVSNNPDYGMAYENLGDVYAELASQAYERAARLDASPGVKAKVAALRTGMQAAGPGIARSSSAPVKTLLAPADSATIAVSSKSSAARKASQKQPEPDSSATPAANDAEQSAVLAAVNGWAAAWSERDMKAYLAAYSNDFIPPRGMTRANWAAERTQRITSKQRISVKVEAPRVTMNGDQATVQFRQQFASDTLRETNQKTLTLIKRDGVWRIRDERAS